MKKIDSHSLKELAYAHHKGMLSYPDYRAKRAELLDELNARGTTEDDGFDDTQEIVTPPPLSQNPPLAAQSGSAPDNTDMKILIGIIALIVFSIAVLAFFI